MGKGRPEAFSDGVFAIAITLLVLELSIGSTGTANDPPSGGGLRRLKGRRRLLPAVAVGLYCTLALYLVVPLKELGHLFLRRGQSE